MTSDKLQGPTDTYGTTYLAAGSYPVNMTYYQNAGGAEFELFAEASSASGVTSFNSNFQLVGNTAIRRLGRHQRAVRGQQRRFDFAHRRGDSNQRQIRRAVRDSDGRRHVALRRE